MPTDFQYFQITVRTYKELYLYYVFKSLGWQFKTIKHKSERN